MNKIRTIYRILRGIIFTAIIFVAVVYLLLYVLLSVPAVQDGIKRRAEKEVTTFIGSEVHMGSVVIKPFNEVVIKELEVFDKEGNRCLVVETLGAGISLWTLAKERRIELTYGEIIGLDARIIQAEPGGPLNIAYIIEAFKPKDKNKPPSKFDLNLRNVVIRRSAASFDRAWMPRAEGSRKTDFNHLRMWDLKADLNLPKISNDRFDVDVRRLSFNLSGGLDVETLAFRAVVTSQSASLNGFLLKLPSTELKLSDFSIEYDGFNNVMTSLAEGSHRIIMEDNRISPSDFAWLLPALSNYPGELLLDADVAGNLDTVTYAYLKLAAEDNSFFMSIRGDAENLRHKEKLRVDIEDINLKLKRAFTADLAERIPGLKVNVRDLINKVGEIELSATGNAIPFSGEFASDLRLLTSCGDIIASAKATGLKGSSGAVQAEISTDQLDIGTLTDKSKIGKLTAEIFIDGTFAGRNVNGDLTTVVSELDFDSYSLTDITAEVHKHDKLTEIKLESGNSPAALTLEGNVMLNGVDTSGEIHADLHSLDTDVFAGLRRKYKGGNLSGRIDADLSGNSIDNLTGTLRINDIVFSQPNKKSLELDHLSLTTMSDSLGKSVALKSDWISGEVRGNFKFTQLPGEAVGMLAKVLPCIITNPPKSDEFNSDAVFDFTIAPDNSLTEFFNLPFRLLVPVGIKGSVEATGNTASLQVDVPYLQQGKNKLVRSTTIDASLDGESGTLSMRGSTIMPVKRGELKVDLQVFGQDDNIFTDILWEMPDNSSFGGEVSLGAALSRNELTSKPEVVVEIQPTSFDFGPAKWHIDKATVAYDDAVHVKGLKISHDKQFVEIDGIASAAPEDSITVNLADIDVGYIFDILNINYVTFGGVATGTVTANGALSKEPIAQTDNLHIGKLSYNGAVLGDAKIRSRWHNDSKMVSILADIMGSANNPTSVDGGIWITRDSLSFDIDAERAPVEFLAPFMSAFASDIKGMASGRAKLYGTFSDIDLTGRIKADSISMKLDFTNVTYHGSDSVYLDPGKITVPSFRLYDRYGNSAILSGELTHRYFHDPRFTFRVSDVSRMLCYDTNAQLNPDWYGTLFGTGSALVKGFPGLVSVSVDMAVVDKSTFTFVLNDTQAAEDYKFLTFSDHRKEEAERLRQDTVPDILSKFRKQMSAQEDIPSKFRMDIRASVNPSTLMTLVMDPIAGDKITARGGGNIQVDYDTESDEMQMFGKYVLEEGNYNFSLQDLILRDFSIRQGSSIAFNGDPLNAILDITASYRVNTNLSDLDKSFSTDRDLARTNVPVDAMLMVEGPMQQPDISFDIELPTLTQDVERKVKSIISTDDMMSRQIIYLLALNRFSTPEYMGASNNGGELASVASSTLSSQLSNMLGQLTDKFSVAPSFRSDKGDFSDLEVDVALSSRLLNNRLLINGNFGYRDRATSQTTFVGDFDIEYLLRRGGNLRLKAYNHFNDQNYYLRQALTTQGLGVIYRKEFDNPFSFLRRKKKEKGERPEIDEHDEHANEDPHAEESIIRGMEEDE